MENVSPWVVRRVSEVSPVPCPCGQSTRVVTQADGLGCSLHVTHIFDSVRHYHQRSSEIYYILEGTGKMDLDDATITVEPGLVVTIPAGTRHRLWSEAGVKTIVVALPAFDPHDEYFD